MRSRGRVPGADWSMRRGAGGCRNTVVVEVRQMQTAEARSAKHERKETEAKTDCKTDQIKI